MIISYNTVETEADWGGAINIMESNNKGFVRVYWKGGEDDIGYLDMLFVNKKHRSIGIASSMIEYCERTLKEKGFTICALWTEKNSKLQEWYESKGYIAGNEYDEKNIWLSKELNYGKED